MRNRKNGKCWTTCIVIRVAQDTLLLTLSIDSIYGMANVSSEKCSIKGTSSTACLIIFFGSDEGFFLQFFTLVVTQKREHSVDVYGCLQSPIFLAFCSSEYPPTVHPTCWVRNWRPTSQGVR
jgi:hypothetical protein